MVINLHVNVKWSVGVNKGTVVLGSLDMPSNFNNSWLGRVWVLAPYRIRTRFNRSRFSTSGMMSTLSSRPSINKWPKNELHEATTALCSDTPWLSFLHKILKSVKLSLSRNSLHWEKSSGMIFLLVFKYSISSSFFLLRLEVTLDRLLAGPGFCRWWLPLFIVCFPLHQNCKK